MATTTATYPEEEDKCELEKNQHQIGDGGDKEIKTYLEHLNELLIKYERDRVIESAILNIRGFNSLLQTFMDLPEIEHLLRQLPN